MEHWTIKWLNMQKGSRSGVFFRNFEHTQCNVQITTNLVLFFIALNRYLCTKFYIKSVNKICSKPQ